MQLATFGISILLWPLQGEAFAMFPLCLDQKKQQLRMRSSFRLLSFGISAFHGPIPVEQNNQVGMINNWRFEHSKIHVKSPGSKFYKHDKSDFLSPRKYIHYINSYRILSILMECHLKRRCQWETFQASKKNRAQHIWKGWIVLKYFWHICKVYHRRNVNILGSFEGYQLSGCW